MQSSSNTHELWTECIVHQIHKIMSQDGIKMATVAKEVSFLSFEMFLLVVLTLSQIEGSIKNEIMKCIQR